MSWNNLLTLCMKRYDFKERDTSGGAPRCEAVRRGSGGTAPGVPPALPTRPECRTSPRTRHTVPSYSQARVKLDTKQAGGGDCGRTDHPLGHGQRAGADVGADDGMGALDLDETPHCRGVASFVDMLDR